MGHSCPGCVRRHVRSWRKPTPHSRRIHRSTAALTCRLSLGTAYPSRRSALICGHGWSEAGGARRRDRARPRAAVAGAAPAVAAPWPLVRCSDNRQGRTRVCYISPEPARLNGNTFPAVSLLSAAARMCADHASSAVRFSSAHPRPDHLRVPVGPGRRPNAPASVHASRSGPCSRLRVPWERAREQRVGW